jgi:hypothetical protein
MARYDDFDDYRGEYPHHRGHCEYKTETLIPGPPGQRGPRGPEGPKGEKGRRGRPAPFIFGLCAYGYAYNTEASGVLGEGTNTVPLTYQGALKNVSFNNTGYFLEVDREGDYEIDYKLVAQKAGLPANMTLLLFVDNIQVAAFPPVNEELRGYGNIDHIVGKFTMHLEAGQQVSLRVSLNGLDPGDIGNQEITILPDTFLSVKKLDSCHHHWDHYDDDDDDDDDHHHHHDDDHHHHHHDDDHHHHHRRRD